MLEVFHHPVSFGRQSLQCPLQIVWDIWRRRGGAGGEGRRAQTFRVGLKGWGSNLSVANQSDVQSRGVLYGGQLEMCHSAGLRLSVEGEIASSQTLAFVIDRLKQCRPVCVEMHNLI